MLHYLSWNKILLKIATTPTYKKTKAQVEDNSAGFSLLTTYGSPMVVPKAITENSRALVRKAVTQIHRKWIVFNCARQMYLYQCCMH